MCPVNGVAAIDLGFREPKDLSTSKGLGSVRGNDDIRDVPFTVFGQNSQFLVVVNVLGHLFAEAHVDSNPGGVIAHNLVHLSAMATKKTIVVFFLQEKRLFQDLGAVILEVLKLIGVVEANSHKLFRDVSVIPALKVQASVGGEIQDVAVVSTGRVAFQKSDSHTTVAAFNGGRETGETGADDDDMQFGCHCE